MYYIPFCIERKNERDEHIISIGLRGGSHHMPDYYSEPSSLLFMYYVIISGQRYILLVRWFSLIIGRIPRYRSTLPMYIVFFLHMN